MLRQQHRHLQELARTQQGFGVIQQGLHREAAAGGLHPTVEQGDLAAKYLVRVGVAGDFHGQIGADPGQVAFRYLKVHLQVAHAVQGGDRRPHLQKGPFVHLAQPHHAVERRAQ